MVGRSDSRGRSTFGGFRVPIAVLFLTLLGLTVVARMRPAALSVTHSLLLNVTITTASLVIAFCAAFFTLMEFMLYGRGTSLLLGLGFLLLACSNFGSSLLPLLAGWQGSGIAVETGWAFQRALSATLFAAAALSTWRSTPSRRVVVLVVSLPAVPLICGAASWWIYTHGAAFPPAIVERAFQLLAGGLFFAASILFWHASRREQRAWFSWLAINFAVGGFAQFQFAAETFGPNLVHAGDILRLLFVSSVLLGLGAEWGRGYRTLRRQTRELEVLHDLLNVPALQDTRDVVQHVARVVGAALGSASQVIMTPRDAEGVADVQVIEEAREMGIVAFDEGPGGQRGLAAALEVRGKRLGTLVITRRADQPFTEHDARLVRSCATQACVLLDRSLLYEEVAAGAVLEERSRLAREIHDGLAQHLAFLKMRVAWLKRMPASVDAAQLQDIEGVLGTALAEARQAITTLRSEPGTMTPTDAIVQYAEAFGPISGLNMRIEAEDELPEVGPRAGVELLRIVQEALNNVRKHAGAERVDVILRGWAHGLQVQVRDDGKGFQHDGGAEGHFGVDIMRERAESIGGTLEVESQIGRGTQVVVWVPARGEESRAGLRIS